MSARFYAGAGSRETPQDICALMHKIAAWLRNRDFVLRSGGANGADTGFERGAYPNTEIFLPWPSFNNKWSTMIEIKPDKAAQAFAIAEKHHPAWGRCNLAARKLHTRNVYQILGADLATPSEFVVCWTKDGGPTGGTGQALRIAAAYDIPVFNLWHPDAATRLHRHVA